MKKTFVTFALIIVTLSLSSQVVHAVYPVSNIPGISADAAILAESSISAVADVGTLINTASTYLQDNVLDPLGNAILTVKQIQQQLNTINFVLGSQGNSLIIQNPEQWIKNQGLNSVRIAIGDLNSSNGAYSSSVLESVVGTYRSSSDIKAKIQSLTQSSIPSLVQSNLCKDANLTNVARNDVMDYDGSFDPSALQRRKQELFNSLCVGNPSTNIVLSSRLDQVSRLRPDIGMWDTWLARTGGDNAYTSSVEVGSMLADEYENRKKLAENTLIQNGGMANATKCDEVATTEGDTGIANIPCRLSSITALGSTISSQFQEALNGPIKKLQAAFGSGIFRNIASIYSIITSVRDIASYAPSSSSGSDSGLTIAVTSGTTAQDLTNKPEMKSSITTPIQNQLNSYLSGLSTLAQKDNLILSYLSNERSRIASMEACYKNLEGYGIYSDNVNVQVATNKANTMRSKNAELVAQITKELGTIEPAQRAASETLSQVNSSNSTEQAVAIYSAFNTKMSAGEYPSDTVVGQREGELTRLSSQDKHAGSEADELSTFIQVCKDMEKQYSQPTYTSE